jgi:hypothetical protein
MNPAWEEDPVPVEGEKGVLDHLEPAKVVRDSEADGGAVPTVAPDDVVTTVKGDHTGVITINGILDLFGQDPFDGFRFDLP